ncbi:hypothetical protein UlMin_022290 [Ulmus minor]
MTKYGMNTHISSLEVSSRPKTNITENSSPLITNHKLTGHNFLQWSQSVFMYICGRGKDEYLTGEVSIPTVTDPKYRTWKTENHMVMSWLINSMTTEVGENFLLYKTTKEIWDIARETYSSSKNTYEPKRGGGRIRGIKPLSTIQEAFSEVRREESRRKLMMIDNSSTLIVEGSALYTHYSSQDNKLRKGRPWCEHCKKPSHTKETC